MTRWNDFVSEFAEKKKIAYGCAIVRNDLRKAYNKKFDPVPRNRGIYGVLGKQRKMRRPPTEAEAKASALKRTASFKRTADAKAKALEDEKQGKKRKPVEVASDPIMDALVNRQLDIINQTKEFRRLPRRIIRKPVFPDYLTEKEYNDFKKFIKAVKESVPDLVNNLTAKISELAVDEGKTIDISRDNVDWRKLWATISSELDDWTQGEKMKDYEEAGDAKFVERKLEDLILEHLDDPKKERDPKIEKQIRDGLIDAIKLDMFTDDTDPYDYETAYTQLVGEYVIQYLYDNFGEDLIGRVAVYERRMTQEEYDAGENEYPFQNIMNQTISDYQLEKDPEDIDDYYVDDFVYPFNNTEYKARGGRAD
jgi:hypothetical protein